MTILDRIVADKKTELQRRKQEVPLSALLDCRQRQPGSFKLALQARGFHLIAEVKQASPSRGLICQNFRPADIARAYEAGGAAAISVLTEEKYFKGSLEHLQTIRRQTRLPLLRKDFIFDPYQLHESVAFGADAVLLIAAVLDPEQLRDLLDLSRSLNLDCLVEVHNEVEVDNAIASGADIIGINNRDLKTFHVDLDTTRRLRPFIPPDRIVVSESGIKERADIEKLAGWAVNAALVGEALVTARDIPARVREMVI